VLCGAVRANLRGLRHVYVPYLSHIPTPENIHRYNAYNNRECLHYHLGARSFEDEPTHSAKRDDFVSSQMSCLRSGCHDTVHNVKDLANEKFCKETRSWLCSLYNGDSASLEFSLPWALWCSSLRSWSQASAFLAFAFVGAPFVVVGCAVFLYSLM
jgi:hypothetical protein